MIKLCIDKVDNGYVITPDPSSSQDPSVFTQDDDHPARSFVDVLWFITEYFGEGGSRYDLERVSISLKKGDKAPDNE